MHENIPEVVLDLLVVYIVAVALWVAHAAARTLPVQIVAWVALVLVLRGWRVLLRGRRRVFRNNLLLLRRRFQSL